MSLIVAKSLRSIDREQEPKGIGGGIVSSGVELFIFRTDPPDVIAKGSAVLISEAGSTDTITKVQLVFSQNSLASFKKSLDNPSASTFRNCNLSVD